VRSALTVAAIVVLTAACGTRQAAAPPALPDIQNTRCPAATTAATAAPSSLPALAQLASVEQRPIVGRIVNAGHGNAKAEPPISVSASDRPVLADQLNAAIAVACKLATPEAAAREGYELSSAYTQGVGTHWTNWRLVDEPFDPTRPAMLLYAPRFGSTRLVGFSYWVRTGAADGPAGFAGTADHWHRHFGLCFDPHGQLQREEVVNAHDCNGTWLNGSDMWMLHAWLVPGEANAWGLFAPLNPVLCSRTAPDIDRCPGFG
jgi:hypothetical protein